MFYIWGSKYQHLLKKENKDDEDIEIIHDSIEQSEFSFLEIIILAESIKYQVRHFKLKEKKSKGKLLFIYDLQQFDGEHVYNND